MNQPLSNVAQPMISQPFPPEVASNFTYFAVHCILKSTYDLYIYEQQNVPASGNKTKSAFRAPHSFQTRVMAMHFKAINSNGGKGVIPSTLPASLPFSFGRYRRYFIL